MGHGQTRDRHKTGSKHCLVLFKGKQGLRGSEALNQDGKNMGWRSWGGVEPWLHH